MRTHIARYLYRLPDGDWQTEMHENDGVKRRRTHPTKKAAELHIARMLSGRYETKMNGGRKSPLRYKMLNAISDFETSKVRRKCRPVTIKRYKPIFEQLRIFVAQHRIEYVDEFTPDHGTALFNALTEPRVDPRGNTNVVSVAAPKTINTFVQTARGLFKAEIANGHLTNNPMAHVQNLPLPKKKPEFYSREELTSFFAIDMDIAYRRAFMGLALTGCRFAEMANLRFEDVDMEGGRIHVRAYDGFQTKTHNAERKIPMGEDLRALMEDIISHPLSDVYPFASPFGHQLRERSLLEVCKRTGGRAGLTSRMFLHKFRHTFATYLVRDGVPLEDIKELLGHSSIKETEIYAHHRPDDLHHQVRRLDGLLSGKKGQHR
ncbi:MAG: tyrosine-type recombinase/integrase [Bacteroidota bacterium]|jgi:integrase